MTAGSEARGDLIVLAGGRSRRFGEGDKATAALAGTPLIRHVVDRCAAVTSRTVLNCRPAQREALLATLEGTANPVVVAEDPVPDCGPLAGMARGLAAAESDYAAVLACDQPLVSPALVRELFDRAARREGAVPIVDNRPQPTYAVYAVDQALAACRRALDRGDRRAMAPLDALSVARIAESDARSIGGPHTFENVNTQSALDRIERRLSARA